MFQIKNFPAIAGSEISYARAVQKELTDFNVGSAVRTILEAPAIEIEEFYQRMLAGVLEAIPVAIYYGFNFSILGEASAGGSVILTFGAAIEEEFSVQDGFIFQNPSTGIFYISTGEVVVPEGATTATIPVYASVPGAIGNVGTDEISVAISAGLPNNTAIGNSPMLSGRDAETEQERSLRFMAYIASLSRGTVAAVKYGVSTAVVAGESGSIIEYVTRVGMVEERGHVRLYLYSSAGTPSEQLLENAQFILDGDTKVPGYRSAGVRVDALAMGETPVDIELSLTPMPGVLPSAYAGIVSSISTRLAVLLDGIGDGDVLLVDEIEKRALSVTGVRRVVVGNNENLICAGDEKLILGTLTVTWNA